ncbi:MAG: hypothetical protein LAO55_21705 [Acidobacteriia bacterium]|nr:hypothetical protein [Terriglobia bacterium]
MAFTDNCELFASVHEDGVNRVINHIRRQRPSWFNYATADIASNRELWCSKIDVTSDVVKYKNSFFTILPPLPILGADSPPIGIGFIAQLTKALIDFHPGNKFSLPPQLSPPLQPQHFALDFQVCGGLGCASEKELEQIPIGGTSPNAATFEGPKTQVVLRTQPICFCLEVFATGHFTLENGFLLGHVDGIEIVDITPDGLESNLECYLKMCVTAVLREKLAIQMEKLTLSFPLFDIATVTLSPSPNPPVPNNPAVEEDQLKIFIKMTV